MVFSYADLPQKTKLVFWRCITVITTSRGTKNTTLCSVCPKRGLGDWFYDSPKGRSGVFSQRELIYRHESERDFDLSGPLSSWLTTKLSEIV